MNAPARSAMLARTLAFAAAATTTLAAAPLAAQRAFASPVAGVSEFRGPIVGVQVGRTLVGGFDVALEALAFFPDEEATREGVHVDRSAYQANLHLRYAFDPSRPWVPYVGAAASWGTARRSVVVEGVRLRVAGTGWVPQVALGVRVPRRFGTLFLEGRNELGRDHQWSVLAGVTLRGG